MPSSNGPDGIGRCPAEVEIYGATCNATGSSHILKVTGVITTPPSALYYMLVMAMEFV